VGGTGAAAGLAATADDDEGRDGRTDGQRALRSSDLTGCPGWACYLGATAQPGVNFYLLYLFFIFFKFIV
jgi:hypothetical protein